MLHQSFRRSFRNINRRRRLAETDPPPPDYDTVSSVVTTSNITTEHRNNFRGGARQILRNSIRRLRGGVSKPSTSIDSQLHNVTVDTITLESLGSYDGPNPGLTSTNPDIVECTNPEITSITHQVEQSSDNSIDLNRFLTSSDA